MNEGAKDVTQRILDRHIIYGASDNTGTEYLSSSKSLNYAEGGSINKPQQDRVTIIPFTLGYSDTVGLFGKENHFVRVNVAINPSIAFACFEEEDWECAYMTNNNYPIVNTYTQALVDINKDLNVVNEYDPANVIANRLSVKSDSFVSVDLSNLKTGNKYIDSWFDVRLYN